jgi:hypothetical protein
MLKELFCARSTNGRWGMAVVGPEGVKFPAQGSLSHVGKVAGVQTYEFIPGETGQWVLVAEDCKVHGGATVVESMSLQSSAVTTLLVLGEEAVIEHYGYKRRSSRVVAYHKGAEVDIPATVLAAMGLVQAGGEVVEIAPPPKLEGAMASAFAALKAKSGR